MLFRVYLKTFMATILWTTIVFEWTNNCKEEKERKIRRKSIEWERKKERGSRQIHKKWSRRTAASVRARKISTINLLYRKKSRELFSSSNVVHWKERERKREKEKEKWRTTNGQTIVKLYVVSPSSSSSPSSCSNEVEYERTCLCVRMWW